MAPPPPERFKSLLDSTSEERSELETLMTNVADAIKAGQVVEMFDDDL